MLQLGLAKFAVE